MKVGIVGTGSMGATHAASWAETEATIAGFVTKSSPKALALADKYQAKLYPTFEAMLAEVDVVDICTPTHLHHDMVLQAAAAGKDIVCEKPLARTVEQGQAMIAACESAGVKLLVAHVVRFFPEYAHAKAVVDSGEIGQPAVLRLTRGSSGPRKAVDNWFTDFSKSGGLILDLMIHDIDYARWIAGEVKQVYAKDILTIQPQAPTDHALLILTHQNGAISHVEGSWAYPPPMFRTRFEIAASDGWLSFDSDKTTAIGLQLHQDQVDAAEVPIPGSPLLENPYTTQLKAFYKALTQDSPLPVTANDGLAAVQIALAAIESAKTGKTVKVE